MNGYEFVERVLGQTNYDVEPLIELAAYVETEWLEFKASTLPTDGKYEFKKNKGQENKWDYRWDISRALVGMANHIGGAVILGVGETQDGTKPVEAVSLKHSGFEGDRDKFMRDVIQQHLISPPEGWPTGQTGKWRCQGLGHLVTPRWGSLFGQPVVVLLVRPIRKPDHWLSAMQSENGSDREVVLSRLAGDLGMTTPIREESWAHWWHQRELNRPDLNLRFHSFLEQWTTSRKKPDSITNEEIASHIETVRKRSAESRGIFSSGGHTITTESEQVEIEAEALYDGPRTGRDDKSSGPQVVQHMLDASARSMLLGDPGSGKSTCFRVAEARLAQAWSPGKPWGLVVDLNEYGESGLRATILRKLGTLHWVDIESRFASGELILFLDALNECPSSRFEECCQEIHSLITLYPGARIHISSRDADSTAPFGIPKFRIRPMSRDQQRGLLEIYAGGSERATALLANLHRQPGAEHFAGSPLLLRIVAELDLDTTGKLPSGLANLYRHFLQKWFHREIDKLATSGTPALWSFARMTEALSLLAFEMRSVGRVSCTVEFARQCITPVIGPDYVARFIDQVSQGLLLARDAKDEQIRFCHETIQEYFAAEYLATHPEVLDGTLESGAENNPASSWLRPLVFAFELIERPPRILLETAWAKEPLLVAVALRDDAQMRQLRIRSSVDPWIRGPLRVMRDEDPTQDARELAFASRLPPKHPLPPGLLRTLNSEAFWYAGESHPAGARRLERLRGLLLDRHEMWVAALPYWKIRNTHWSEHLSPVQKRLAGFDSVAACNGSEAIDEATVVELCTMLHYKLARESQFAAHWRSALERSDTSHLESDLLAIIRTAAKIKTPGLRVNFKELGAKYGQRLADLGLNWNLSLRLLHLLVQQGFVRSESLRDDPERLSNLIERMSAMNMYRFLKSGILQRSDIPAIRLRTLANELKPQLAQELVNARLLIATDTMGARLSIKELESPDSRRRVELELATRNWDVTVSKVLANGDSGFVSHPQLNDGAFFHFDRIDNPNGKTIREGGRLNVRLEIRYDQKRDRWGYAVKSGEISR